MGLSRFLAPRVVDSWQTVLQAFRDVQAALDRVTRSNYVQGLAVQDLQLACPGFYRVSPPLLGIRATIPRASEDNASERICLSVEGALGSITIFAPPGQTIAGSATATFSANGLIELYSNGVNGWVLIQQLPAESPTGVALTADVFLGVASASFANGRVATASTEITPSIAVPNAASWSLNTGSVVLSKLQNLAGLSVLGRAANSSGVMAAITAGGAQQYLRSNVGGTSLEFADPASASIINTGGQLVRAAVSGDVAIAQGLNVAAFRSFASKSVLANASSIAAIPSDLAGTAAFQHLRVNATNNGLEWSVLTSGDFPAGTVPLAGVATQAANTFVANATAGVASPTAVASNAQGVMGRTSGNIQSIDSTVQSALIRGSGSVFWGTAAASQALCRNAAGDLGFQSMEIASLAAIAAKSVVANATNASAIPAALAGSAAFQHLRVNSTNTGLEWSVLTTGDFPAGSVPLTALATIPTLQQVCTAGNTTTTSATAGALFVAVGANTPISLSQLVAATDDGKINSPANLLVSCGNTSGSQLRLGGDGVTFTCTKTPTLGSLGLNFTNAANPATPTPASTSGSLFCNGTAANPRLLWRTNSTQDWPADCAGLAGTQANTTITALTTNIIVASSVIFANALDVGSMFKWEGHIVGVAPAAPPTLTCEILIGATVVASAVISQLAGGGTSGGWVQGMLAFTVIGASGKAIANCGFIHSGAATFANAVAASTNVAVNAGTFNTTGNLTLLMQVRMTTAVAAASLTVSMGSMSRVR